MANVVYFCEKIIKTDATFPLGGHRFIWVVRIRTIISGKSDMWRLCEKIIKIFIKPLDIACRENILAFL
jgi:hypothetical protein